MPITIKTNALDVSNWIGSLVEKQIPWFMLRTANDLAFATRAATTKKMESVFVQPTPWTLKSIWVDKAKDKMNIKARVWLNDYGGQERVIQHEFTGGLRRFKPFEGQFLRKGIIDKDLIIVPAAGCPLDSYGNPKPAFMVQMLSYLNVFGEQGYRANMTEQTKKRLRGKFSKAVGGDVEFFISTGRWPNQNLPAGIWMRVKYAAGSAVKPVFLFVRKGAYLKRIDIEDIARNQFETYGKQILDKYLQDALEEKLSGGE